MALLCIKHPHEKLSFDVCFKCLDSIPSEERADVIASIREEYEIFTTVCWKVQDSHNGNE